MNDLTKRWEKLQEDIEYVEFDYEAFKCLAVDTFNYLYQYHDKEYVPREMINLVTALEDYYYSNMHLDLQRSYVDEAGGNKSLISLISITRHVAREFDDQIKNEWRVADKNEPERWFVIKIPRMKENGDGTYDHFDAIYEIDATTFNLQSIMDDYGWGDVWHDSK